MSAEAEEEADNVSSGDEDQLLDKDETEKEVIQHRSSSSSIQPKTFDSDMLPSSVSMMELEEEKTTSEDSVEQDLQQST